MRRPVNPRATTLSGSGSKRVFQLKPNKGGLVCLLESLTSSSCFPSTVVPFSLLLLLTANSNSGCDFREMIKGLGLKVRVRGEENGKNRCGGFESESLIIKDRYSLVSSQTSNNTDVKAVFFFLFFLVKNSDVILLVGPASSSTMRPKI